MDDVYYGMRRKRNIDLSRFREQEVKLEEGYEEYEEELEDEDSEIECTYASTRDESEEMLLLNGKPFIPKIKPKKQSFSDTHVRITTYLEKNVQQIIRILQQQGQIESITKFVNDSIKEHLMNKYNDNTNE
ncbi:hypothetical protein [Niallia nealsonii]|uniref:Uncharacterized protein n=1 Tax=Niallia nealsonii TaxID=115979 RepID=A0A2N0Z461_9BACI|nr:hypothetical protein [Niallia nealsonii]PKG24280.1 hypothetical protein CWS01_07780 [Niallia nealsonii]